ncbi:hypothetical protein EB118_12575 [bacterium]|nr:hypothetical protein [bacterium]NDG30894.1 hypothetical protein [bacterium]
MLLIDFRERDFKVQSDIPHQVCNLPVGDFVIKTNDQTVFIIERKTMSDLAASVIDNRFREQKARLVESVDSPDQIVYVIEKNMTPTQSRLSKTILDACIINLIFKHKLKVIFTNGIHDTIDKIQLLYKKVQNGDLKNVTTSSLTHVSKTSKNESLVYKNMLCVVSGISENIAQAITLKYPTMHVLVTAFVELGELVLKDIPISDKRKVGPAISKKLYAAIFGNQVYYCKK